MEIPSEVGFHFFGQCISVIRVYDMSVYMVVVRIHTMACVVSAGLFPQVFVR